MLQNQAKRIWKGVLYTSSRLREMRVCERDYGELEEVEIFLGESLLSTPTSFLS